jgi:hypothetical protein
MLILGALILGVLLCMWSYAFVFMAAISTVQRWIPVVLAVLTGLPGLYLLGWFVFKVVTLS